MTDNQKAATFVGWKKGRVCKIFISGSDVRKCICGYELPAMSSWSHEELAPDMSRPENYMRALEALKLHQPEVGYRTFDDVPLWYCDIDPEVGSLDTMYRTADTLGEVVFKALVALYDAQNK